MNSNNNIFNPHMWGNGPAPGRFYNFPGRNAASFMGTSLAKQRAGEPITTGTSVLGLKYDKGVIIAADNLVSYGSLARFQKAQRVFVINDKIILGAGNDYADFQNLNLQLNQRATQDIWFNKETEWRPRSIYNWVTRVLYNYRSRGNPLKLDVVVGGWQDGKPFLGHVDMRGRPYEDHVVVTGLGKHLALPLVREKLTASGREHLTYSEAEDVVKKCMEVLYYRDCRAVSDFTMGVCNEDGAELKQMNVDENWLVANTVEGF